MKKKSTTTTRQRYLSLVARLYEIAAEFTDDELRTMVNSTKKSESPAVGNAINALIQLHDSSTSGAPTKKERPKASEEISNYELDGSSSLSHQKSRWLGSVENILLDRLLFSSANEVAKLFPENMQPQPKESRARYVKRAVRFLGSLSEQERIFFKSKLSENLPAQDSNNFISSWKTLIKDL